MKWHDIVYDPGSTTKAFKFLTPNYSLNVLFSDFDQQIFKRSIVIKLDNVPVMVASSETDIANSLFLDILKNAQQTPIGLRLFAPESGIKRGKMKVTSIDIGEIEDQLILSYLHAIGIETDLYFRESVFSCGNQSMKLSEYVLPGLKFIVERYQGQK